MLKCNAVAVAVAVASDFPASPGHHQRMRHCRLVGIEQLRWRQTPPPPAAEGEPRGRAGRRSIHPERMLVQAHPRVRRCLHLRTLGPGLLSASCGEPAVAGARRPLPLPAGLDVTPAEASASDAADERRRASSASGVRTYRRAGGRSTHTAALARPLSLSLGRQFSSVKRV
jgi:hypothetical protein